MSEAVDAAVKKITTEEENSKQKNSYMTESIADYVIEACQSDEVLAKLALQEQKTLDKCIAYITQKAKEYIPKEHGNTACIPMPADTVYGWVREYYNLDDAEESRKKAEANKKKTEAEKKAQKAAQKEAKKQDPGQISFF